MNSLTKALTLAFLVFSSSMSNATQDTYPIIESFTQENENYIIHLPNEIISRIGTTGASVLLNNNAIKDIEGGIKICPNDLLSIIFTNSKYEIEISKDQEKGLFFVKSYQKYANTPELDIETFYLKKSFFNHGQ